MADYFTHFSCIIDVGTADKAARALTLFQDLRAAEQEADEPEFRRQVEWELGALESADVIVMYFAPGTQSPISLLEMGLHARGGGKNGKSV